MRRLMSIAAFSLFLAVPLWAQRGGGHGGGGHAGFGGGHSGGFAGHGGGGHMGGGHFSGGSHGGFARGFSHSPRSGFSRGSFRHNGFRGPRFRTHAFRNFGFRNNCFGYGCWGRSGYPWWGSAYYDPWAQDDRRFDEDYYRQYEIANEMNEQSLEQQQMLRQEEAEGDQDAYAPQSPRRGAGAVAEPREEHGDPMIPATLLVFRDQHKEEISNYAIVGQTLWNFAPQRTEKISLAELDLPATEKANDDRGVTFRVPATNEGQ